MKPLNTEERRKAFFQYLAMYLFTTAFLVFALSFNWRTPSRQNEILLDKVKQLEAASNIPTDILNLITSINEGINSIESASPARLTTLKASIAEENARLSLLLKNDTLLNNNKALGSYKNAVEKFMVSLENQIKLKSIEEDMNKLKNDYAKLDQELKECKNENSYR